MQLELFYLPEIKPFLDWQDGDKYYLFPTLYDGYFIAKPEDRYNNYDKLVFKTNRNHYKIVSKIIYNI